MSEIYQRKAVGKFKQNFIEAIKNMNWIPMNNNNFNMTKDKP